MKVFLTLFVLIVVALCVSAVWPLLRPRAEAATPESRPAKPDSLEGVLTAQLVLGEITQGQYRRAVERLAARDAERHPLSVPPEFGPTGR